MNPVPLEFSRLLAVDRVPKGGSYEKIAAESAECAALAKRFDIPVIHRLSAELHASPWRGGGLKLEGTLRAGLEQISVVSLEAFRHDLEIPVLRYFMPAGSAAGGGDAEIDHIEAGHVDLGEVVAETLALELNPYPRKPGEDFQPPAETPEKQPAKPSPFAVLAKLKPK